MRAGSFLIILTDGFEKFESAKQFNCYTGLSPTEKTSGTSVRGARSISKHGNPKIRNLLFMCSFNACKSNKACRDLYVRLVAKGKSKKLALIAVSNKLIKQSFSIAKSGLVYLQALRFQISTIFCFIKVGNLTVRLGSHTLGNFRCHI